MLKMFLKHLFWDKKPWEPGHIIYLLKAMTIILVGYSKTMKFLSNFLLVARNL